MKAFSYSFHRSAVALSLIAAPILSAHAQRGGRGNFPGGNQPAGATQSGDTTPANPRRAGGVAAAAWRRFTTSSR